MISSCKDCKTPCCRKGPAPHKPIPAEEYIEYYGDLETYGKKCVHYKRGKCLVWETPLHPLECRVHVCHNRKYSEEELQQIDNCTAEVECPDCDMGYVYYMDTVGDTRVYQCPNCDAVILFSTKVVRRKK